MKLFFGITIYPVALLGLGVYGFITRASFCCSKKVRKLHLFSTKVAFMRRKLHLCAQLTAKDLTQPIFVCMDLAKSQDSPLFHL